MASENQVNYLPEYGGLGVGMRLFWAFVSSAVLVLAIRGDKVLSSQLLSLFWAIPWLTDWI